jgi:beta-phosphoglucomutase-like phosphatase (HAD superfamily)
MRIEPAFLFDLDGTLVDSVYQHVLAWKEALDAEGIELSVWRIHRKIGMSGGLFTNQLLRRHHFIFKLFSHSYRLIDRHLSSEFVHKLSAQYLTSVALYAVAVLLLLISFKTGRHRETRFM